MIERTEREYERIKKKKERKKLVRILGQEINLDHTEKHGRLAEQDRFGKHRSKH